MAEPRVTLTVRLLPAIYEEAREAADSDGVSVNELVARAIHQYTSLQPVTVGVGSDEGDLFIVETGETVTDDTELYAPHTKES